MDLGQIFVDIRKKRRAKIYYKENHHFHCQKKSFSRRCRKTFFLTTKINKSPRLRQKKYFIIYAQYVIS